MVRLQIVWLCLNQMKWSSLLISHLSWLKIENIFTGYSSRPVEQIGSGHHQDQFLYPNKFKFDLEFYSSYIWQLISFNVTVIELSDNLTIARYLCVSHFLYQIFEVFQRLVFLAFSHVDGCRANLGALFGFRKKVILGVLFSTWIIGS